MSIAQLTNPFQGPIEEEIAIFCEARGFLPNSLGATIFDLSFHQLSNTALVLSATVSAVLLLMFGNS